MIVMLINESEGKAWLRTRRILSKYLPQIGSRCWAGHISNEGLEDLHLALKKAASKSGSISCHRVTGRNNLELQWIAGNKNNFDEVGRYSFRSEATKPSFDTPISPTRKALHLVVQLAALLHDIGKANAAFQAKLRGEYFAEYYRHDVMSYFMILAATKHFSTDQDWLKALCESPETVFDWKPSSELSIDTSNPGKGQNSVDSYTAKPLWYSVIWLVLTHHRLPNGENDSIQLEGHFNEKPNEKIASKDLCLRLAAGTMPWSNTGWLHAVTSTAKQLLALTDQTPQFHKKLILEIDLWILATAHWARPCLVYADHLASIAKVASGDILTAQRLEPLANTCGDERGHIRAAGDSLTNHLVKTKRYARRATLVASSPRDLFRCATLSSASLALTPSDDSRYIWQSKLGDAITQHTHGLRPTFVGVIAGTGCGKTLAGVRVMHALSNGQMRYTLALGLRSLTLQSAKAMISQAGFHTQDIAIAIGQPQATQTIDRNMASESGESAEDQYSIQLLDGKKCAPLDSGSLPLWLQALDISTGKGDPSAAADLFATDKHRMMIDTPILVCTADHLVAAVEMRTGGSARMALRMMSSDLLLDEIDAYSAQDLQSIGKLAMFTGMSGRSVVIMSATANSVVVSGIYNAWATGLKTKRLLDGERTDNGVVILGAQQGDTVVIDQHDVETVKNGHVGLVAAMKLEAAFANRRLDLLDLTNLVSNTKSDTLRENIFEQIINKAHELHATNGTIHVKTSVKVSCGFVRFNHAKHAWLFAQYLVNRPVKESEASIQTLSYHAKHPRIALGLMDEALNRVLNRQKIDDFWTHPEIQSSITLAKIREKCDALIIVATTTLQETGRDHDYDWAILEPRSVRGEIQASGRVRRHRTATWDKVNISLLSHPLRAIYGDKNTPHWGLPGVEESTRKNPSFGISVSATGLARLKKLGAFAEIGDLSCDTVQPIAHTGGRPRLARTAEIKPVLTASDMLPVGYWMNNGISAFAALDSNHEQCRSTIGSLETITQNLNLLSKSASSDLSNNELKSLRQYLAADGKLHCALTNSHARRSAFRQSQRSTDLYVAVDAEGDVNVLEMDELGEAKTALDCKIVPKNPDESCVMFIDLGNLLNSKRVALPEQNGVKRGSVAAQLSIVQIDQFGDTPPKTAYSLNLGFIVR